MLGSPLFNVHSGSHQEKLPVELYRYDPQLLVNPHQAIGMAVSVGLLV